MKKHNRIMLLILIMIIGLTSGCGSNDYLKDENNKIVLNEQTGQSIRKDIICKPNEGSELYKIYEKYNDQMPTKLEDLKTCENFDLSSSNYTGLWDALLVKPLALIILKIGTLVGNYGISVMIVGLLIRLILMPFSIKTMRQSKNMQKAQPEIMRIEKKYSGKTDSESMMAKSQETMMIYQKYKINPIGGCLIAILQIPLFFAFLSAINKVPAIFEGYLFGMNLGMTPLKGLQNGEYIYIILIVLIIASTYASFKNTMNQNQSNQLMGNMNSMLIFMLISISMASLSLPTAIAYYWIIINAFSFFQNYFVKKILEKDDNK